MSAVFIVKNHGLAITLSRFYYKVVKSEMITLKYGALDIPSKAALIVTESQLELFLKSPETVAKLVKPWLAKANAGAIVEAVGINKY